MPELTRSVRLSHDDLELFSRASGDFNPLHLLANYTRKTAYGRPVVYGMLGALAGLGFLPSRPGRRLKSIALDFPGAMFPETEYSARITQESECVSTMEILDGDRVMLVGVAEFETGESRLVVEDGPAIHDRVAPKCREPRDLIAGIECEGEYHPRREAVIDLLRHFHLADKGVGEVELGALLWASYVVGMELPGERALFGGVVVEVETSMGEVPWPMGYSAKTVAFDQRFDLLRSVATLHSGGRTVASAEFRSFVRRDAPSLDRQALRELLPTANTREGKVALVTGASRGLGAAITAALAEQGCTVIANYHRSDQEAHLLEQSLVDAPGQVHLARGDAGDSAWWSCMRDSIETTHGGLDLLVCNACPPLTPLPCGEHNADRLTAYIKDSVSLVAAPMCACLDMLAQRLGWLVTISSSAVEEPPPHWAHYVSAKRAIEGLAASAAVDYRDIGVLVVRAPRMKTALTNVPMGHARAIAPESVAARIVTRLSQRRDTGQVMYMSEQLLGPTSLDNVGSTKRAHAMDRSA